MLPFKLNPDVDALIDALEFDPDLMLGNRSDPQTQVI